MRRPRRNHSLPFKAKVALAALHGTDTLTQLTDRYDVHSTQIAHWQRQPIARAAKLFATEGERRADAAPIEVKTLHAKIGQQALELDLFGTRARTAPRFERMAMIDRTNRLAVTRQATLLGLSRASVHYVPRPVPRRCSRADAALRRPASRAPLRGESDAARSVTIPSSRRRSRTRADADAPHRHHRDLSAAEDQPTAPRASRLPVSAVDVHDRSPQPGLGLGHYLYPDGPGLRVPRRRDGLGILEGRHVARVAAAHQWTLGGLARGGASLCEIR